MEIQQRLNKFIRDEAQKGVDRIMEDADHGGIILLEDLYFDMDGIVPYIADEIRRRIREEYKQRTR